MNLQLRPNLLILIIYQQLQAQTLVQVGNGWNVLGKGELFSGRSAEEIELFSSGLSI